MAVDMIDINPGSNNSFPFEFTEVGGLTFFVATTDKGQELWKTDGTQDGTSLVKDINPGSIGSRPYSLTNVGGTLYFVANDGSHGRELWKSDGTELEQRWSRISNPAQMALLHRIDQRERHFVFRCQRRLEWVRTMSSNGTELEPISSKISISLVIPFKLPYQRKRNVVFFRE